MKNQQILHHHLTVPTFLSTSVIPNDGLLERLKNKILEQAPNSKESYATNIKAKFTGFKSLIGTKEMNELGKEIEVFANSIYRGVNGYKILEAWGNVYENNDFAQLHDHKDATAFCGILYLSTGGPGTFFPEYNALVPEEYGKLVLFSPLLKHEVKPSDLPGQRITLAMNSFENKPWV